MRKLFCLLLALTLALGAAEAALAETMLEGQKDRAIQCADVGLNPLIDGESPTTGLVLEDYDVPNNFSGLAANGTYLPMLVQIDNSDGGVNARAPWGASYADIVYESPLHKNGSTRISFLFSDLVPDSVGPVRSARVGHCYLREEWDAGFLFYGGQERDGSNINDVFRETGASKKGVLFSGIVGTGKPWKKYYTPRKGLASPHNMNADVAAMQALIPATHEAPNHAFLFTDDAPYEGEDALEITLKWGHKSYDSSFTYDMDSNVYFRYCGGVPYEDMDSGEHLSFSNVIIQRTTVTYNHSSDAPVTQHIGQGNADIFINGQYIPGYWIRKDVASRTVFYDQNGQELQLQRGKTFIAITPYEAKVAYSD